MLTEIQLEKYADILLWGLKTARIGKFKKNNIVLIRYDRPALRLVLSLRHFRGFSLHLFELFILTAPFV